MEYIYGKNPIIERLRQNKPIRKLYLNKNFKNDELLSRARNNSVVIEYCDDRKLNAISEKNQGCIAEIDDYKTYNVEDLLSDSDTSIIMILDGIEDPHNLGAILRTSDSCGVDGIIIPKHRSVRLNSTVAKVSTGAIENVKTAVVSNISQSIRMLKENGYWIYAADFSDDSRNYWDVEYKGKIAIVLGSEGKGISRLVLENCDLSIHIPMLGSISSLNVSVCAALIMYEIRRQNINGG